MCCSLSPLFFPLPLSYTTRLSLVMCILNSPNDPTSIYPLLHIYNKLSRLPYLGKIIFFSSFFISFFKFIIYHFLNLVFRAGSIVQRYICLAQAKPWVQFILPPHTHTHKIQNCFSKITLWVICSYWLWACVSVRVLIAVGRHHNHRNSNKEDI